MKFYWNTATVIHLHIMTFTLQRWVVCGPYTENMYRLTLYRNSLPIPDLTPVFPEPRQVPQSVPADR